MNKPNQTEQLTKRNYPNFKVFCECFTYNHSKYITDAMNGFTMQQTSFPFVCCIVDDASNDGEQEVIRQYVEEHFELSEGSCSYHKETNHANITYAQHKTNKNCFFAVIFLKENHYSQRKSKMNYIAEWRDFCKYEALCEGDDYWTDRNKLQKQVDFLDFHQDYAMCFHNAMNLWEDKSIENGLFSNVQEKEYTGVEIFRQWIVPTASVTYRLTDGFLELYNRAMENPHILYGDICIFLSCAANGKIQGMRDCMSVYRRTGTGASAVTHKTIRQRMLVALHHLEIYKVFGIEYKADSLRQSIEPLCYCFIDSFLSKNNKTCWKALYIALTNDTLRTIHLLLAIIKSKQS